MPSTVRVQLARMSTRFCASTVFSYQLSKMGSLPEPGWKSNPCASAPSAGPSAPASSDCRLFGLFVLRHAESTSPPRANTVALPSHPSTVRRSTVLCATIGGWCGFTACLDALVGKSVHKGASRTSPAMNFWTALQQGSRVRDPWLGQIRQRVAHPFRAPGAVNFRAAAQSYPFSEGGRLDSGASLPRDRWCVICGAERGREGEQGVGGPNLSLDVGERAAPAGLTGTRQSYCCA
jgi:hypothetical protein